MNCEHAAADLGVDCEYCSMTWVRSDPTTWTKREIRKFGRLLGYNSCGLSDGLYWFSQQGRDGLYINVGVSAEDIANGDAVCMLVNGLTRVAS